MISSFSRRPFFVVCALLLASPFVPPTLDAQPRAIEEGAFFVDPSAPTSTWITDSVTLEALLCGAPGDDPLSGIEPALSNIGTRLKPLFSDDGLLGPGEDGTILRVASGTGVSGAGVGFVRVEPLRLCMQGVSPIPTSCGLWELTALTLQPDVRQRLSTFEVAQFPSEAGGVIIGTLDLRARLAFRELTTAATLELDLEVRYGGFARWAAAPGEGGLEQGLIDLDHNCDGVPESTVVGNPSFYVGWRPARSRKSGRVVDCLASLDGAGQQCFTGVLEDPTVPE